MWQTKPEREQKEETKQSRWGFRGMTVRNWLELLIVPMVLVGIGLLFEMQQADRQQATEKQQQELAEQRAQDEALQAYLDQMSQLMLERKLLEAEQDDPVHTLAQARTSTVILRLDAEHNASVIRFLRDSGLIRARGESAASLLRGIALEKAKLRFVDLRYTELSLANLSKADLRHADLRHAYLGGFSPFTIGLAHANLSGANLFNADLSGANLNGVDLLDASLGHATLRHANLTRANLNDANLRHTDLFRAKLSNADLSNGDLSGAKHITNEELEQQAKSLEGTTMPNGQKYEDWLKSKNRKVGGKNDGSS